MPINIATTSKQPEYERLWWRLEQNAYTYEHPLEKAARLKAEEGAGDDEQIENDIYINDRK